MEPTAGLLHSAEVSDLTIRAVAANKRYTAINYALAFATTEDAERVVCAVSSLLHPCSEDSSQLAQKRTQYACMIGLL